MVRTISDWKYIVKVMMEKGYTVNAIAGTLTNLGLKVPRRTLYDNLPWRTIESFTMEQRLPLSQWEVATEILGETGFAWARNPEGCSLECEIPPEIAIGMEGDVYASPCVLDLTDLDPAEFLRHQWVYYPTSSSGSGLKTYLHRCDRENRSMTKVDVSW